VGHPATSYTTNNIDEGTGCPIPPSFGGVGLFIHMAADYRFQPAATAGRANTSRLPACCGGITSREI